jgi:hypothetical protein
VDCFDALSSTSRGGIVERVHLCYSFQAATLRHAAGLAAELRTVAAFVPRISTTRTRVSGRRDWIVTVTTPQIPLTLMVLRRWEEEMLAIERRWSGCRFLGWRIGTRPREDAAAIETSSQRQLVVASLLRHPPGEYERSAQRGTTLR